MTIPYRVTFTDETATLTGHASNIGQINDAIPDEAHIRSVIGSVEWGYEAMTGAVFMSHVNAWRDLHEHRDDPTPETVMPDTAIALRLSLLAKENRQLRESNAELLAACETALDSVQSDMRGSRRVPTLRLLKDAIDKAKGETA
jgi:hypothetical protein